MFCIGCTNKSLILLFWKDQKKAASGVRPNESTDDSMASRAVVFSAESEKGQIIKSKYPAFQSISPHFLFAYISGAFRVPTFRTIFMIRT